MTLTEFLLARIAEDELHAESARGLLGIETPWHTVEALRERGLTRADARHVARWSSARVLAECEAKRRIMKDHAPTDEAYVRYLYDADGELVGEADGEPACRQCTDSIQEWRITSIQEWRITSNWDVACRVVAPCDTIRALAAVYADHPDYRQEWAL